MCRYNIHTALGVREDIPVMQINEFCGHNECKRIAEFDVQSPATFKITSTSCRQQTPCKLLTKLAGKKECAVVTKAEWLNNYMQ